MVEFEGLSGHINFDTNGLRSQFSLELLELQQNGLQTVGTWNSVDRLMLDRDEKVDGSSSGGNPLANKTFTIVSAKASLIFLTCGLPHLLILCECRMIRILCT